MSNESASKSFTVYAEDVAAIEAKLVKLAKKAGKLGVKVPSLSVVREFVQEEDGISVLFAEIEIDCEVIRVAGNWLFVASLETVDRVDGVPRNKVNGPRLSEEDHKRYMTQEQNCDHCHHNRRRNKTFIVKSVESGETKQVGSTCLKEFLGIDPADLLNSWGLFDGIDSLVDGCRGKAPERFWKLEYVGPVILSIVSKNGFVSRSMCVYSNLVPTCQTIADYYNPPINNAKAYAAWKAWHDEMEPTEEQIKLFEQIRGRLEDRILDKYLNDPQSLDGFAFKLGIMLNRGGVNYSDFQVIAAAVNREAGNIAKEIVKASKVRVDAFYPCEVGDKIQVEAAIEMVRECKSFYGSSLLVKFLTADGFTFSTFYSGRNEAFTPGETVTIKGTVKRLEDSPKYGKTVLLNRVRVLN